MSGKKLISDDHNGLDAHHDCQGIRSGHWHRGGLNGDADAGQNDDCDHQSELNPVHLVFERGGEEAAAKECGCAVRSVLDETHEG